jgi:hypothetical protein
MRKLILISALLLASASAQAGETILAANDQPAATTTPATAQPLPPANQADTSKPQTSEPAKPDVSKPRTHVNGYESDEARARRIAAKYGVHW